MNIKRLSGDVGENAVVKWLSRRRYKIISRNFFCRFGEIDIIAQKGGCICFVEVKARSQGAWERPASAVDIHKQRRIITTAQQFLTENPSELQPRFDVAEVFLDNGKAGKINYIENAFGE